MQACYTIRARNGNFWQLFALELDIHPLLIDVNFCDNEWAQLLSSLVDDNFFLKTLVLFSQLCIFYHLWSLRYVSSHCLRETSLFKIYIATQMKFTNFAQYCIDAFQFFVSSKFHTEKLPQVKAWTI